VILEGLDQEELMGLLDKELFGDVEEVTEEERGEPIDENTLEQIYIEEGYELGPELAPG